jgi:hypothetical protein
MPARRWYATVLVGLALATGSAARAGAVEPSLWPLYATLKQKTSHSIDFSGNALSPSQLPCYCNV